MFLVGAVDGRVEVEEGFGVESEGRAADGFDSMLDVGE